MTITTIAGRRQPVEREPRFGLAPGRATAAAEMGRGSDHGAFIDTDCWPSVNWREVRVAAATYFPHFGPVVFSVGSAQRSRSGGGRLLQS